MTELTATAGASFRLQELEQFGAWHKQFATQRPAHFQFTALNEPVHTEIIDAQQVGGFLNGIGQPAGQQGRLRGL